MITDDFGNEVQPASIERDPVAYWRGAIAKMGDDCAPQVPVRDLRFILKALAATTGERIRMCNTDDETCGWVGYESECAHHMPDVIRCPKCHEATHTVGPGTVRAFRAALAAAEQERNATREGLERAEERNRKWENY